MPSQIKLFKIISLDTFIQLLLLSLSLFPSLTHTHATYLSFNDPQIQQRHHLHFNLSFPIHVTSSPFDQSLSFTRNPQRKDPLFCTSISPSRSSLYTCYSYRSLSFASTFQILVGSRINQVMGSKTSVASNRKERRSWFPVRLALVGTQFLEIIRSSKEVGRSFLGSRFKLVPRGELTSRHNLESFVDRGVSRHR